MSDQKWIIRTVDPDAAKAREICESVVARHSGEPLDTIMVGEMTAECMAELRAADLSGIIPTIEVSMGVARVSLSKTVTRIDCTINIHA